MVQSGEVKFSGFPPKRGNAFSEFPRFSQENRGYQESGPVWWRGGLEGSIVGRTRGGEPPLSRRYESAVSVMLHKCTQLLYVSLSVHRETPVEYPPASDWTPVQVFLYLFIPLFDTPIFL